MSICTNKKNQSDKGNIVELNTVRKIVNESILQVVNEAEVDSEFELDDNTNLLNIFDSMDIVALIMETESKIYSVIGKKIPLADEYTFDSQRSPFSTVESWTQFVNKQIKKY
jgi:hypothetical protein